MYPSSIDSFTGYVGSETLSAANNASQLNQMQASIVAIETKLGTGSSTSTSGTVLVGNGSGSSTWGQASLTTGVTGVLPTANGGTGTNVTTGSGANVFNTGPTLNDPNTVSLNNIDGMTNSGGLINTGGLTTDTLTASSTVTFNGASTFAQNPTFTNGLNSTVLNNPYKFSVYKAGNQTVSSNTWTKINLDTKVFDTSSNFDNTTNYQFTAPISGFYWLAGAVGTSGLSDTAAFQMGINIGTFSSSPTYTGGTQYAGAGSAAPVISTSVFVQMTANQTAQLYGWSNSTTIVGGAAFLNMQGFLVSTL